MRKGNLVFLILFVSIFAFSLYALEKQGTPLVKKEKPLLASEKGVSGCCKEDGTPLPLATTPVKKPAKLQAKGEKDISSKEEETSKAPTKKLPPAGSKPGKAPSSDVKLEKESEKKGVSSDEEEGEGEEEEFEEYDDDESGPEEDEDADFSEY